MCVSVSVCYLIILENASFRFFLNPLLERMWVLLINNCGDFWKTSLLQRNCSVKPYCLVVILKDLCFCWCQQKNTETLTFVSLKLCFLGFVHRHDELFFSYCGVLSINSQVQIWIRADEERTPTHCSIIIELRLGLFMLRCMWLCVQSNIFVVRVLHFSAFIIENQWW